MIDMEAFKRYEFAVLCSTKEDFESFLKECEAANLTLNEGSLRPDWTRYEHNTCVSFEEGNVCCDSIKYYRYDAKKGNH
jgi:hypothetical protein